MNERVKQWLVPMAVLLSATALMLNFVERDDQTGHKDAEGKADIADELQSLRKEIQRVRAESREQRVNAERFSESDQAAVKPGTPTAASQEVVPELAPPIAQSRAERHQEVISSLEARFASEEVDVEWRTKAVREIQTSISSSAPGSRILEADCASSLCRVVLAHDTEEARRNVAVQLGSLEPFKAGVLYSYDRESKPPQTTLLIQREGSSADSPLGQRTL
jgi:hypothetical protein